MIDFNSLLTISFILYLFGIIAVLIVPKNIIPKALGLFGSIGSFSLLIFGAYTLLSTNTYNASLWYVPNIGRLSITVDHLSAFFLIVTAIVAMPASIFAATHINNTKDTHAKFLSILYLNLLIAIVLVLIASNVFFFLLAWEIMSILIYLLVNSGKKERPGYLMLAIGETGTLAILVSLVLLARNTGSLSFAELKVGASGLGVGLQWSIFLLSFFGFGVKGGIIPLNFWISRAYSITPKAFIPLIAGATLNLGLYGIIRVNIDLLPTSQVGIGIVTLLIGSLTALIGILYATIEDDLKTVLAHSSIENAGIIITALGASMVFLASGHKIAGAMALVASLYHLLNHSVFKTLLFMGAGALEDATKTRSLDKLGGLLKYMPWTGFFVLIGALSISAMPPFNGFVSELLTLQSLLRSVELASLGVKIAFITAGVFLALTAGLAVTCFARVFSMGFLGMPRSQSIKKAKETTKITLASMAFLALVSLALGVLPTYVIPTINTVVQPLAGASATTALVPPFFTNQTAPDKLPKDFVNAFSNLGAKIGQNETTARGLVIMHRGGKKNPVIFAMSPSYMLITIIALLTLCYGIIWLLFGRYRKVSYRPRWDGGVRHFLPEMTYTATGFAQPVRVLFNAILHPKITDHQETVAKHFRMTIQQERKEVHLIDRLVLYPLTNFARKLSFLLAKMHNGRLNDYAGYALLILIVSLSIVAVLFS